MGPAIESLELVFEAFYDFRDKKNEGEENAEKKNYILLVSIAFTSNHITRGG